MSVERFGDDLRIVARVASRSARPADVHRNRAGRRDAIVAHERAGDGVRARVDAGALDCADIAIGDSIAVAGCCLTVVENRRPCSASTSRRKRCAARPVSTGRAVNLEKALRFGDRLGGHLVSGHVDGVGTCRAFRAVGERRETGTARSTPPIGLARSSRQRIGGDRWREPDGQPVDGAPLHREPDPAYAHRDDAPQLAVGATVNLEVDVIARYVERLREAARRPADNRRRKRWT